MPNSIKYSTDSQSLALKKGNFYIATGDVGKGPTSTTGYYNGITPPGGGYTIYVNKASGGPSIYVASNDTQLISLTNRIAGTSYSTANECLSYFAVQTDKMVFNKDYESIVTNGLVMVLDPSFTPSYPKGGNSINNLSTNPLTFTLTNGVGFSSDGGGSLVFDGVDDVVTSDVVYTMTNDMTWSVWVKKTSLGNQYNMIFSNVIPYMAFRGEGAGSNTNKFHFSFFTVTNGVNTQRSIYSTLAYNINTWYNVTFTLSFDIPNQLATGKIYVNGLYDTQLTVPTGSLYQVNNTNRLRLGSYPSSQYPFPGNIGLFSVYSKILSAQEIFQNYQSTFTRFLGENIVTNGLVLYLDAGYIPSYPTTGTTWYDVSGLGNNGTLTNGPTYNSGNGGSIVFDGIDDFISVSDTPFRFTNTFTLDAWVYFNGNNIYGNIMGKRNGPPYNQYSLSIYSGNPYIGGVGKVATFFARVDGGNSSFDIVLNYTLPSAGIYNIVASINNTSQTLYVNGVDRTTTSVNISNNTFNISERNLLVGAVLDNAGTGITNPFSGNIYNTKIYNRPLSSEEVSQNFNAQKSRFGL